MKRVALFCLILFLSPCIKATTPGGKYVYTINIVNVVNDRVMIELKTPRMSEKEVTFYLPKIVPGTYRVADYGRYVGDFKAFDKKGNLLPADRVDENTWTIQNAKKLDRITYWVEDTYDSDVEGPEIFPMAGTNIEDRKNFVMNTPGYFGYFKGQEKEALELNIIRPPDFYGSTGLILKDSRKLSDMKLDLEGIETDEGLMVDVFEVEDYHKLVDSPLLYCVPDTTIIKVADAEVLISVYSPKGLVSSTFIGENLRNLLMAQKEFLGGELPIEKYAFLFYFEEPLKTSGMQGALEHSYSSFYYFPEISQVQLQPYIISVAAHEFFHIVTPLTIHSEEIEYFDFNDPKMSQHLWMYEGMTEYFADLVQVKYDLITQEEYLSRLREKMVNATTLYNDSLSFTDLSRYTIEKYPDEYQNVYEKGALIGRCLDIKLRDLSGGEYGVQDLMKELSTRYGKNSPFSDDELFNVIGELTYPEIREFIDTYIVKGAILPYQEIFETVGIDYVNVDSVEVTSFGFTQESMGIDIEKQRLYIRNEEKLNSFGKNLGFREGDVILKMNGEEVPGFAAMQGFLSGQHEKLVVGNEFSYTVLRGENEVELSAPVELVLNPVYHSIRFSENPTEEQLQVRESWIEPVN